MSPKLHADQFFLYFQISYRIDVTNMVLVIHRIQAVAQELLGLKFLFEGKKLPWSVVQWHW